MTVKNVSSKIFWLVAFFLAPIGVCSAQDAGLPGAYLNFAGGPQPLGMGRAFTGLAQGTDALTFNPAGLGFLKPNMISFLHTQTAESAHLDYIGYAQPLYQLGGIGLGYVRMDSGSIPQTDEFNRQVGSFSDTQQTFLAGYGISPFHRIALGGTFKFATQNLSGGGSSSSGWGADIGGLVRMNYGFSVGVKIQNAVAPSLYSGADRFPRSVTVGLAEKLLRDRLALTFDTERTVNVPQAIQMRMGAEGTLWQVVRLRGGFDFNSKEFSLGMGYLWGRTGVDVASTSGQQGASNRIGMTYAWGGYDVSVLASPSVFSPVGITKATNMAIKVDADRPIYSWALQIMNQNGGVVRSIRGSGRPPTELEWDGTTESATTVPPGIYTYTLTVTDRDGQSETTPPRTIKVEYGTPVESIELHGNR